MAYSLYTPAIGGEADAVSYVRSTSHPAPLPSRTTRADDADAAPASRQHKVADEERRDATVKETTSVGEKDSGDGRENSVESEKCTQNEKKQALSDTKYQPETGVWPMSPPHTQQVDMSLLDGQVRALSLPMCVFA